MKNIRNFLYENFHFLVVKFSVYLNRRVFVMSVSILKAELCILCFLYILNHVIYRCYMKTLCIYFKQSCIYGAKMFNRY